MQNAMQDAMQNIWSENIWSKHLVLQDAMQNISSITSRRKSSFEGLIWEVAKLNIWNYWSSNYNSLVSPFELFIIKA